MTHAAAGASSFSAETGSVQTYARLAGVLGLISAIAGGFGGAYVPGVLVVAGDAASRASRSLAHTFLLILAPAYATGLLLATAAAAFIPLILWLLVKGVDEEAWRRV